MAETRKLQVMPSFYSKYTSYVINIPKQFIGIIGSATNYNLSISGNCIIMEAVHEKTALVE